jgi:hypothetical protein
MEVQDALRVLGVDRTVWIDDYFGSNRDRLANSLIENEGLIAELGFEDLAATINAYDADYDALKEFIERASQETIDNIRQALLNKLAESIGATEFSPEFVQKLRQLMNIHEVDCWDFSDAGGHINAMCATATDKIGCIVDLNNALGGDDSAGIGTLRQLSESAFKGTVFMLTHEATLATEADIEKRLRESLKKEMNGKDIPPVCVISKQRFNDIHDDEAFKESLRIAVKRAGLRRSVHDVLGEMKPKIAEAFAYAQDELYGLAPEQLDKYIVDKGYDEGLSELSVVERAVTAQMAAEIRKVFAASRVAQESAIRMRNLRSIDLKVPTPETVEASLSFFRRLEIWEDASLVNEGLSPLASGDVFAYDQMEFSAQERRNNQKIQRFLLLGQPCDIQRRGDGKRRASTALLVPLTEQTPDDKGGEDKFKKPSLPFTIHDKTFAIDFGSVATVKLDILELACFRQDGRVAYEKDQASPALLPGLEIQHAKMKPLCGAAFANSIQGVAENTLPDPKYLLVFGGPDGLSNRTKCKQKAPITVENQALKERVTWGLRREGRIRAPFAAAVLRMYLAVVGREAYEIDFTAQRNSSQSASTSATALTADADSMATNEMASAATSSLAGSGQLHNA